MAGTEPPAGRASEAISEEVPPPTAICGATSGDSSRDALLAILEPPVVSATVVGAGAAGVGLFCFSFFEAGSPFRLSVLSGTLVFAFTGVTDGAGADVVEAAEALAFTFAAVVAGAAAGFCCVCSTACACADEFDLCDFTNTQATAAAATTTTAAPRTTNLFTPAFSGSPATASRTPKLLLELAEYSDLCSGLYSARLGSRFSSFFFGNGTGTAMSAATATGRTGSIVMGPEPLVRAGAAAAALEFPEGLITTGGSGVGATAGFGLATATSTCGSSLDLRSFCSSAEIWSAMVLSTAT